MPHKESQIVRVIDMINNCKIDGIICLVIVNEYVLIFLLQSYY